MRLLLIKLISFLVDKLQCTREGLKKVDIFQLNAKYWWALWTARHAPKKLFSENNFIKLFQFKNKFCCHAEGPKLKYMTYVNWLKAYSSKIQIKKHADVKLQVLKRLILEGWPEAKKEASCLIHHCWSVCD